MSMDQWFKGNVCYIRAMCHVCRADTPAGKNFRLTVIDKYGKPNESSCFECKHGIPWGCEKQKEQKSRGLGDTVEKVTRKSGVKKIVNLYSKVTGKPCGCDDRQTALNKKKPYANTG